MKIKIIQSQKLVMNSSLFASSYRQKYSTSHTPSIHDRLKPLYILILNGGIRITKITAQASENQIVIPVIAKNETQKFS